jgi:hypothetical protein
MCIAKGSVQEHICKAAALDVHVFMGDISEDNARRFHALLRSFCADVGLTIGWEAQQPQHTASDSNTIAHTISTPGLTFINDANGHLQLGVPHAIEPLVHEARHAAVQRKVCLD